MFANLNINGPPKKNMTTLLFHSLHNNNNKKKNTTKKTPTNRPLPNLSGEFKKKVHCFKYVNKMIL